MGKKQQKPVDHHLDTPAESNQDHHIDFRKVEEESASIVVDFHNTDTDRQKRWRQGLEEGRQMQEQSNQNPEGNTPQSGEDDTLGQQ